MSEVEELKAAVLDLFDAISWVKIYADSALKDKPSKEWVHSVGVAHITVGGFRLVAETYKEHQPLLERLLKEQAITSPESP